ncbi:MAG: hypothetical protein KJ995_08050 [Candidatus Omnitrophica bacterium]|nr:hypothetical protein [Candidatus Omnitrophota bacterium]
MKHMKKTNSVNLENPSEMLIRKYLDRWVTLENYILQERSLNMLFEELCPHNQSIEHVLLKVSALNDFYSTNIYDTYSVAKHILNSKVDEGLQAVDYGLVNKIAKVTIKNKTINFYSFATKYCSHHKPLCYPIYDSFVEKMLLAYKRLHEFAKFKKEDLKDYKSFIRIIKDFKKFYQLDKFTLRQIDIFLWLAGKEFFPKKYK